ncbi:hypothetical protein [Azospirillum sp. sgz302134]
MSATIDALFGAASTATAKWKPISAAQVAEGNWKATSAPVTKPVAPSGDSVEVSGLAKSLTGVAGKVFAALGSKGRAMLEGFVKSGQMSEEEVARGLRSMATSAVRGRFMKERPQDEEDKAWAEKGALADKALHRKMERMNQASEVVGRERQAAHADFEKTQDTEAFQARMQPVYEAFRKEGEAIDQEARDTAGGDPMEVSTAAMNHFLKKGMTEFEKLDFGDEDGGFLPTKDKKGAAAVEKMADLGFIARVYRNALAHFAADVDIPGIGRGSVGDLLPDSDPSAAEEAAASGKPAPTPPPTVLTTPGAPGQRSFSAVADDAREALDAGYASMAKAGQKDMNTLFGAFDRRSLYAIASNSGKQFSKDEQAAAQSAMARQQDDAMKAANPTGADPAAAYRAAIAFLDKEASEEEKSSAGWSLQRAAVQFGYESSMRRKGEEPTRLDSASPLARMLKGALDSQPDKAAKAISGGGYVKDLANSPLFRDGVPGLKEFLSNAVRVTV